MKKQRIKARVADLVLNEGQLDWLPENPRSWTRTDIDRTIESFMSRGADGQPLGDTLHDTDQKRLEKFKKGHDLTSLKQSQFSPARRISPSRTS